MLAGRLYIPFGAKAKFNMGLLNLSKQKLNVPQFIYNRRIRNVRIVISSKVSEEQFHKSS